MSGLGISKRVNQLTDPRLAGLELTLPDKYGTSAGDPNRTPQGHSCSAPETRPRCNYRSLWRLQPDHTCETGLIIGAVGYLPEPVEPPAAGNLLICCSQPQGDIALDL